MFKKLSAVLLWLVLAAPALAQGNPTCPTRPVGDHTNACASTAFVQAIGNGAVKSVFGRTGVVSAVSGDYTVGQITGAAPLASPTFTGVPVAPTAAPGTNTTQLATTAFVLANSSAATGVQAYDTVAIATAATIPNTPTIYLRGYAAAGDAGAGFWTRSAGVPSHTAYFQSADGAYWSPSLANITFPFEMFGGSCGGSGKDNTPPLNKYNSFITAQATTARLFFASCVYWFNTQPSVYTIGANINGTGSNSTVLLRNFNGTNGVGFLQFTGASGVVQTNMQVQATAGTSGGDLVRWDATSSNGSSGSYLQNVTTAPLGTDNYQNGYTIDGHLKVAGSPGSRDHTWSQVSCFGSAVSGANLSVVVGLTWMGGGCFPAGGTGTNSGGMVMSGNSSFDSTNLNIILTATGALAFDFCTYCGVRSPVTTGGVVNTANTDFSWVGGRVTGTPQANWTNSNYTVN